MIAWAEYEAAGEWASPRTDWPRSYRRVMIILTTTRKITIIRGKRLRWSSIITSVEAPAGPVPVGDFISTEKCEEIVSGTLQTFLGDRLHTMVCMGSWRERRHQQIVRGRRCVALNDAGCRDLGRCGNVLA